jgi:hypothetical protein
MERLRVPPVPILGGRSVNPLAFIACHVAIPRFLPPACEKAQVYFDLHFTGVFCMLLLLINPLTS